MSSNVYNFGLDLANLFKGLLQFLLGTSPIDGADYVLLRFFNWCHCSDVQDSGRW